MLTQNMLKHKIFTTERNFLAYISPFMVASNKINQESALNEYRERLEAIVEDLKWMLSLPYQKFWCQALHDASFQRLVDTYLKFAPRYNSKMAKLIRNLNIFLYTFISKAV